MFFVQIPEVGWGLPKTNNLSFADINYMLCGLIKMFASDHKVFFTVRRYASVIYAIRCVCVCLSHADTVSKRLNVGSRKQHHTIAQGNSFPTLKISVKFERGHPNGVPNASGVG